MNDKLSFDDVLDIALDSLHTGEPIESVLTIYPGYAAALRPMLETALAMGQDAQSPPSPQRLTTNFFAVRSALQDARALRAPSARPAEAWWLRQRLTFASLSLPLVGVAAIVVAGAGGAAAASLALAQPGAVREAADTVTPDWLQEAVLVLPHHREAVSTPTANLTSRPTGTGAAPSTITAPGADAEVTVAGAIHDVRRGTFAMTGTSGGWHVVTDDGTAITGIVSEGAIATVRGRASGNTLHAITIAIMGTGVAPTPAVGDRPALEDTPTSTPHGNSDNAPGKSGTPPNDSGNVPERSGTPPGHSGDAPGQSSTPPGDSPNAPGENKTPPPEDETPGPAKTPPGQSEKTKTPRGQGNGHGAGSKNS